ncbi:MAG TPA: hypothetical protein VG826_11815 [Pirellulales bacterium]|nr:hypothetical protein [Pirellulales bacterium]
MAHDYLTTGEIGAHFGGQPEWRIRRVVDELDCAERFCGKRAIPRQRLSDIEARLIARGWLPAAVEAIS